MHQEMKHVASSERNFKYQQYLEQYFDCPPSSYESPTSIAFRWVHTEAHPNDFTPLHLITTPPNRMLDDWDKMCMGYGLSMFGSFEVAKTRYLKQLGRLKESLFQDFVEEKGSAVAQLGLSKDDGIASYPHDQGKGHFTFHEYEGANLYLRIINITPILE
jgi:hypothetical protein